MSIAFVGGFCEIVGQASFENRPGWPVYDNDFARGIIADVITEARTAKSEIELDAIQQRGDDRLDEYYQQVMSKLDTATTHTAWGQYAGILYVISMVILAAWLSVAHEPLSYVVLVALLVSVVVSQIWVRRYNHGS